MGLFDFLKSGKKQQPDFQLPVMADVRLGGTVQIDPLALQMLGAEHRLKPELASLIITGQGQVAFEDGVWLHRYYTDDHMLLQIMGGDGVADHSVQQISLFMAYDVINPANSTEMQAEIAKLRQPTYVLDDITYERIWFDGDGLADPVQYYETVHLAADGSDSYGIQQTAMLYARDVGGVDESLLVTHERTTQGDESISLMVGAILSENDMTI